MPGTAVKVEPQVGCTPVLRWAGSKRKLIPRLAPYWGEGYSRYLEPFAGSSALFFALAPPSAVLSDINEELIETLECIRDNPREIHRRLNRIECSEKEYYRIRAQTPRSLSLWSRAARFIYLNRNCFNGLYRTNLRGQFNVPFAATGTGGIPPLQVFVENSRLLKRAELVRGGFEEVIRDQVREGDFVYLDPPYAVSNRRIFRQYGPQTFGLDDLEKLRSLLSYIDSKGAVFLMSYADCKESRTFAADWNYRRIFTQRNIAGFSRHRRRAGEALITNITV